MDMFEVCVDTGGTFTDCVVSDGKGRLREFKSATTPGDLSIGMINSLKEAAASFGLSTEEFLRDTRTILHGTTVALNAFLTRSGAKTALITTKGFRDIIEMHLGMKNITSSMYNVFVPPYEPLVPRNLRFTVEERTRYTGDVMTPLSEAQLGEVIAKLKREEIGALAICFLHSYINPDNEKKAAEICRQELDGVFVCASHEVMPLVGEHARESTSILNAYIGPIVSKYFAALEERLKELHFSGQLLIMQADALVQAVPEAKKKPVYLINSGPASGPSGAVHIGKLAGTPNLVTIDMGGTSLDIGFVKGGEISLSRRKWIDEEMLAISMVDISTLGAGGGSLAWFDSLGLLRVGPDSAGAEPGPACYGKGGTEAAVTDADLILGYIPADYFLGGAIKLDTELARTAVGKVAERLNMSVEQAAHAIFSVVNHNMADAITEVTTKNGHDVRDFSLFSFGGAGAVHAAFLAEALGIPEVIVPKFAASFCAWSMFSMDIGRDYLRPFVAPIETVEVDVINQLYADMIDQAVADFRSYGVDKKDLAITKSMEMRYQAQFHDVEVGGIPEGALTAEDMQQTVEAFHRRHEDLYTFSLRFYNAEVRGLRILAKVVRPDIPSEEITIGTDDSSAALKRERPCFFDGGFLMTPIYEGARLKAGNVIKGPAIVEEPTTTVVIPKSWDCHVDKYGNYSIKRS
jgi:N-methylhydantoinase A